MKSWPLHQVGNRKRDDSKQREGCWIKKGNDKCKHTGRRRVKFLTKHTEFSVFLPPYSDRALEWTDSFVKKCSSMGRGQGMF